MRQGEGGSRFLEAKGGPGSGMGARRMKTMCSKLLSHMLSLLRRAF